jgi:polyprenyl-phospho-N-acetylgalactosaminyl synthase
MPRALDGVWVVIAAFNEQQAIGPVVRELAKRYPRIIVVDDGSRDDTAGEARAAGAVVMRHLINLGQGAALQTGIDFAVAQQARLIVTFDADGQHDPDEISRLIAALEERKVDIACGSRFLGNTENMSLLRRIVLRLATLFTFVTTGLRVTDAHNGFRVMTREAARKIRLRQNRMAHASEIIHQISEHDLTWTEVPVTIRYTEYSLRKGQGLGNALNILIDLAVGRLHR